MEKQQLEHFRQVLEQRAAEVRRSIANAEDAGREVTETNDFPKDTAEQGSDSYTKEFAMAQSSNERMLLSMIEGALERVRQGTFGQCVNCGKEINIKRLEAVPWTRHDIDCQQKLERGETVEVEN
jgi:DnaK suppressor protein